ncbi:MAG: hypothetical protein M1827_001247 [Pycnora praestabilis]|nr:MAG: hypothetical protein M1827_001247 [Pycnora praestabilis]
MTTKVTDQGFGSDAPARRVNVAKPAQMRSPRAIDYLRKSRGQASLLRNKARLTSECYCSCSIPRPSAAGTNPTTKDLPTPPADHRILGNEQELFTTSLYSPGSPLFLPNGAHVFNKLLSFLRAQYKLFGFQEVITPTIYKKTLWQKSGHWENYKGDMFEVSGRGASGQSKHAEIGEDEEYGLKPMNCPGHCLLFKSRTRDYGELPIRYADFSPLHRNETSGALSGLTRVRRFHQDDGHIFCRPKQITEEISKTLDFVAMVYKTFRLGPYKLVLSTRPAEKYIGTIDEWDSAEGQLKAALDGSGRQWTINEGDGAFYGPKIDIILRDSDGKEHQTATIQLDFQLPQRFELHYQARAPELEKKGMPTTDPALLAITGPVTPVIVHRAILGSLERFTALLIEHYNGSWPFWISPRQAIVLTVNNSEGVTRLAKQALDRFTQVEETRSDKDNVMIPRALDSITFTVDLDDHGRSLSKKVALAKSKKYNILVVVGPNGVKNGTVDLDITGQPNQASACAVLAAILGRDAIFNPRSVSLTLDELSRYFTQLAKTYE